MHYPAHRIKRLWQADRAAPSLMLQCVLFAILAAALTTEAIGQAAPAAQPKNDPIADAPATAPIADGDDAANRNYEHAVVIRFEGPISGLLEQYVYRKLEAAKAQNADLVVLEIDSPGGEADASFNIAEALRDVTWARTVAFIPKTAYSGAAVVALGCDEILMAPSAQLGDVGMIFLDAEEFAMKYVPEKVLSAYVRRIRDLAKAKGRAPALAESMMDRAAEVWLYRNTRTGIERYMTQADAKQAGAEWSQGVFVAETAQDRFLTVGGKRALELELIEGLAADRAAVMERFGVVAQPTVMQWNTVDTVAAVLTNPWVTALLIIVGLVALYIEFSAPGIGIGGALAALCFILFFWSRFFGGTAEWLEVTLFVAGLAFLGVELFVLPGFGVIGLTGLLLMVASVVLASQDFVIPETDAEKRELQTNLLIIAGSGVGVFAGAVLVSKYFGVIPVLSALRLEPPTAATTDVRSLAEPDVIQLAVGSMGETHTALRPGGKAHINGRLVDVVADGAFINRGQPVQVVEIAGTRVVVREAESAESSDDPVT
jgi:membrane-bound serine protease (ClpP class)